MHTSITIDHLCDPKVCREATKAISIQWAQPPGSNDEVDHFLQGDAKSLIEIRMKPQGDPICFRFGSEIWSLNANWTVG